MYHFNDGVKQQEGIMTTSEVLQEAPALTWSLVTEHYDKLCCLQYFIIKDQSVAVNLYD